MNKGIIYKIKFNETDGFRYLIKLETTVKIDEEEFNIYIKDPKERIAELIAINTEFSATKDLTYFSGKKLGLEIDLASKKIVSIEYEA